MKKLLAIVVLIFFVAGCTAKFTIPDEPKYKGVIVFHADGMVCFGEEGMNALQENIQAQREYADKMRKILEGLKK